jgi:hypothetical protein
MVNLLVLLRGKPYDLVFRIERWRRCGVVFPLGGIVRGAALEGRGKRWCGVPSLVSTTAGLSGMEPRGLGDGRGLMDSRRTVALSGVMVASTAGLARLMQGLILKMGSRKTEAATSKAGTLVRAEGLPDQLCHLFAIGRPVEAFGV